MPRTLPVLLLVAVIGAAVAALFGGHAAFRREAGNEARALLAQARGGARAIVTEEMLQGLPAPVQRYLRWTGVVGKPVPRTVRLKQVGRIRSGPERPWMALDAEQYYTVDPPGFVWIGAMRLAGMPIAWARDRYARGSGGMVIRAGALFGIADVRGDEITEAALLRYLGEMIWFPAAFLGRNVSFQPVDERSVRVTLTDAGRSVSGTLYVDRQGRVTDFVARRHRFVDGRLDLQTWSAPVREYGEFEGLRLPVKGPAVWKLEGGDFEYIEIEITDLQYDDRRQPDGRGGEIGGSGDSPFRKVRPILRGRPRTSWAARPFPGWRTDQRARRKRAATIA